MNPHTITDSAHQTQDLASLNRDTSGLNGTVSKLPDVNNLLSQQSDVMNAANAAGAQVAQAIGTYADYKEHQAQDGAKAAALLGESELAARYKADAQDWSESGTYRVLTHVAGGAVLGGLGGGSVQGAVAGAVGAGVSAELSGHLNDLANSMGDPGTVGHAIGNGVANIVATAAGAVVGGSVGAFNGSTVDLYNRQLHPDEYAQAKKNAQRVADGLGISVQEAEGRIIAEILRNSDQQAAEVSGDKHDYEVRSIVGCQNLNCNGYKTDPYYADHNYNSQYISLNQSSYDLGQQQLGRGQTYNELVTANIKKDPVGATLAGAGMIGLGVVTGGSLAPAGMMGIGATVSLLANGGVQLAGNQPFDWRSFALAGGTGAASTGMGFVPVLLMGTGGALTGSVLNGQNPNGAMAGAAVGTAIGYPIGAKIEGQLNSLLNPWYRQEWQDIGMGISKYVPPSAIPSWMGGFGGGVIQEKVGEAVQNKLNGPSQK